MSLIWTNIDQNLFHSNPTEEFSPSWFFISNFCKTYTEHDTGGKFIHVPKSWEHLPMLCLKLDTLFHNTTRSIIACPKSRQIMVSWICALWMQVNCMKYSNQVMMIQSKKQEDSSNLLARCKKSYSVLPDNIKSTYPLLQGYRGKQKREKIEFKNGSTIEATPQGADQVRSRTPSAVLFDEAAFQDDLEESVAAAKECAKLIILVSSAYPGYFQRIIEDTTRDNIENYNNSNKDVSVFPYNSRNNREQDDSEENSMETSAICYYDRNWRVVNASSRTAK